MLRLPMFFSFFFFNDTATTEIYTLSLHDALPIYANLRLFKVPHVKANEPKTDIKAAWRECGPDRSEEHTSELQSPDHLVCRLLLEKKKTHRMTRCYTTYVLTTSHPTSFLFHLNTR